MSTQKVSDAMIADMAASKLSGALPALDGSALTGLPDSITKNASDPAIDTNPSGGLGTLWLNTTSGELFMLTDATTDSNVWFNTGGGTGNIGENGFSRGGTVSGYTSGGHAYNKVSTIDKFTFSSDANATSVGNLVQQRYSLTGHSSSTHGYSTGGFFLNNNYPHDTIDKFSFTVDGSATDVGDLTRPTRHMAGTSSTTHGYISGGATNANIHALAFIDNVGKFSFSTDGNASDVSTLSEAVHDNTGITSDNYAYSASGYGAAYAAISHIDKMDYASDSTAVNIADMSSTREGLEGSQSSTTHGYCTNANGIDKFSFSSDADATDVGTLSVVRSQVAGQSSTTHGYASGGAGDSNVIDKFNFSTDGTATDVGDLTEGRNSPAGHQY